jgi:hypothetical protein
VNVAGPADRPTDRHLFLYITGGENGCGGGAPDVVREYFVLKGFVPALLGATDVLPIHRRRKDTVTRTGTRASRSLPA